MTYIVRRTSPELAHLSHLDPLQVAREMSSWEPFQGLTPFTRFVSRPVAAFAPTFEVKETKDAFIFRADLPGVEEKNIEVSLTGNLLTLRIPKKPEHQPKKISIKVAEKAKAHNGGTATHR